MARGLTAVLLLIAALPMSAQQAPDVEIRARVTAKELQFEEVPNIRVTFLAPQRSQTVWETDRENLPEKVQPRVLYRNIGITLTITSTLEDIEQIVAEALGEVAPAPAPPATPAPAPRRPE